MQVAAGDIEGLEEGQEAAFSRVISNGVSKYKFNDKEVSFQVRSSSVCEHLWQHGMSSRASRSIFVDGAVHYDRPTKSDWMTLELSKAPKTASSSRSDLSRNVHHAHSMRAP